MKAHSAFLSSQIGTQTHTHTHITNGGRSAHSIQKDFSLSSHFSNTQTMKHMQTHTQGMVMAFDPTRGEHSAFLREFYLFLLQFHYRKHTILNSSTTTLSMCTQVVILQI